MAQGGNFEDKDVITAGSKDTNQNSEEEWSVIDLKDDECLMNKEKSNTKKKSKKTWKQIKGATSVFSFGKNSMEKSIFYSPSLNIHSAHSQVLPSLQSKENNPLLNSSEKCKRKPFRMLLQREKNKEGFTKWNRSEIDDEIAPLSLNEKSDSESYLASYQLGEGSEIKLTKNKLHFERSPSEFCLDEKV